MSNLNDFSNWKEFLADKVEHAESLGMKDETMANMAQHVGDYLSAHVDPKNKEQRVLQELWDAASPEEQEAIASTMIKLVQQK